MKVLKQIFFIIMILSLTNIYCKPSETKNSWAFKKKSYSYTVIPNKLFGIDFCKIEFVDIIKELQTKKIDFKFYDPVLKKLVKYSSGDIQIKKIEYIETDYFIGTDLDKDKIIQVTYENTYNEDWFHFTIKFQEDYYETLLEKLGMKLGKESANYNSENYGETSWDPNPAQSVHSCFDGVIVSKKLKFEEPEKSEKGVCYLEIVTRTRSGNVP